MLKVLSDFGVKSVEGGRMMGMEDGFIVSTMSGSGVFNGDVIANSRLGGTRQKFKDGHNGESNTAVGVCVRGPARAVFVWLAMEAHQQGPERHLACPPNLWDAGPK